MGEMCTWWIKASGERHWKFQIVNMECAHTFASHARYNIVQGFRFLYGYPGRFWGNKIIKTFRIVWENVFLLFFWNYFWVHTTIKLYGVRSDRCTYLQCESSSASAPCAIFLCIWNCSNCCLLFIPSQLKRRTVHYSCAFWIGSFACDRCQWLHEMTCSFQGIEMLCLSAAGYHWLVLENLFDGWHY